MLRSVADQLCALHSNGYDYAATRPNATARQLQRYETVFKSTIYETEHPVVQVHPLSGNGPSSSAISFAGSSASAPQTRRTRLPCFRITSAAGKHGALALVHGGCGDLDNRATQHKAIDDYGDQPRIVRRITIEGPVSVGIDGRLGKRRNSDSQVAAAARKVKSKGAGHGECA